MMLAQLQHLGAMTLILGLVGGLIASLLIYVGQLTTFPRSHVPHS